MLITLLVVEEKHFFQNKELSSAIAGDRHFCTMHKPALSMTLQEMTLSSIIQRPTSRHIRETAVGISYKLICNTYFKYVEQGVTFLMPLVMVIDLFRHN